MAGREESNADTVEGCQRLPFGVSRRARQGLRGSVPRESAVAPGYHTTVLTEGSERLSCPVMSVG